MSTKVAPTHRSTTNKNINILTQIDWSGCSDVIECVLWRTCDKSVLSKQRRCAVTVCIIKPLCSLQTFVNRIVAGKVDTGNPIKLTQFNNVCVLKYWSSERVRGDCEIGSPPAIRIMFWASVGGMWARRTRRRHLLSGATHLRWIAWPDSSPRLCPCRVDGFTGGP